MITRYFFKVIKAWATVLPGYTIYPPLPLLICNTDKQLINHSNAADADIAIVNLNLSVSIGVIFNINVGCRQGIPNVIVWLFTILQYRPSSCNCILGGQMQNRPTTFSFERRLFESCRIATNYNSSFIVINVSSTPGLNEELNFVFYKIYIHVIVFWPGTS